MTYATPTDNGWQRLRWPAIKRADGTEVRPGEQGVTPELLAAVGAVQIVDPGPTLGENETVESRALVDVDGSPTVAYTVRPLTAEELAAKADAADRAAKLSNVGRRVAWLREQAAIAGGHTVTQGNAVATVQAITDNLAVFYAGFADLLEGQRIDER